MKCKIFTCIFVLVSLGSAQSDTLVEQAVGLVATRHINIENLKTGFDILLQVVDAEPNNLRAHYELSKIFYLMGDNAETKDEKLKLYNQGIEYGKKALKIDSNSAWSHFWYLVNLGRTGQTKGVLNSLMLVSPMKKEIAEILKIDSNHTGALDVRAMLYYELPRLFGGNLNKSIDALNRAIAMDSNYTILYVDMAKVYLKKKDYQKARWYLNRVLEIKNPTYEADYILDDKPEAMELLKKIEK